LGIRKSIWTIKKFSDEVLAWLSGTGLKLNKYTKTKTKNIICKLFANDELATLHSIAAEQEDPSIN